MFVSVNRYSPLTIDDTSYVSSEPPTKDIINIVAEQPAKIKLPPPIFVRGILRYTCNQRIKMIGSENIIFKLSTNNFKVITTPQPTFYRKKIHFLKENNAQHHTYQPLEDKPFRVVVRNLHPSTPTNEIGIAKDEIGFSVRQVTNVIQKIHKKQSSIVFCRF